MSTSEFEPHDNLESESTLISWSWSWSSSSCVDIFIWDIWTIYSITLDKIRSAATKEYFSDLSRRSYRMHTNSSRPKCPVNDYGNSIRSQFYLFFCFLFFYFGSSFMRHETHGQADEPNEWSKYRDDDSLVLSLHKYRRTHARTPSGFVNGTECFNWLQSNVTHSRRKRIERNGFNRDVVSLVAQNCQQIISKRSDVMIKRCSTEEPPVPLA